MAYKVSRCLLHDHLDHLNMTQQELANKLGVTKQQVHKYVSNRQKMSLEVAYNISIILGCSIEELYEWYEVGTKE